MNIDIPFDSRENIGNALIEAGFEEHAANFLREYYGQRESKISIKIQNEVTTSFLEAMIKIAENLQLRGLITQCKQSLRLIDDPSRELVKTLRTFETGIANYIARDAKRGWLFYYDLTENYTPYIPTSVRYNRADIRNGIEASVSIDLDYNSPRSTGRSRKDKTIHFGLSDVKGKTIPEALANRGYFKETDELIENYLNAMRIYLEFQPMFGKQFVGKGKVETVDHSWSDSRYDLAGKKRIKMVNDEPANAKSAHFSNYTEYSFWKSKSANKDAFTEIPFHPYIRMFDLNNHRHYWVLADQMEQYKYDKTLGDKLILPEQQRDLIDILVDDMDVVVDDIVDGKSGGTTILCLGEPGVGKTLTAEVYSEIVGRPLYRVHSGQLGTSPDKIDERLQLILERSENWGSILLIDEADVYIRQRDNSMEHNAIVAAFLRKLEYFSGLLFMTTNRADDVDDAIKSRAMAIVKYEKPKQNELKRIWQTLSAEFKMDLKESVIDQLVHNYPDAVGRDVKELLKLAKKYNSRKGRALDIETFRHCAMFRGIEHR